MKTLTLTAALLAASAILAAPAFAENAVQESQAKVDRALGKTAPTKAIRATTFSAKKTQPTDRYSEAKKRLFKFRSPPAGK